MIVLDTNVLSELMKPQGSQAVKAWVKAQPRNSLFITTITQAEILYGIAILPIGAKRQILQDSTQAMLREDFLDKILFFDSQSANYFAIIASHRRGQGKPICQFDAQIAAICRTHQATLATRNVDDFTDCQIEVINPWESPL
jgi:toxin FitB